MQEQQPLVPEQPLLLLRRRNPRQPSGTSLPRLRCQRRQYLSGQVLKEAAGFHRGLRCLPVVRKPLPCLGCLNWMGGLNRPE